MQIIVDELVAKTQFLEPVRGHGSVKIDSQMW